MTEIERLDARAAAAGLLATPEVSRGFLGLDPVTQNDALIAMELTRLGAQVFRSGEALLGFVPNGAQPRQGTVATTSTDQAMFTEFLRFLSSHQRCTSFVAMVPVGGAAEATLRGCGFDSVGVLRGHRYQSARYHDVGVFHTTVEDKWRS